MPLDWDDGILSGYLPILTFPRLWLGISTSFARDFIAWLPSRRTFQQFIDRVLPQNLRINIFDLFSTMKTCSSTPSRDTAADKTAAPTPQPRSTTPLLDLAAGRKQARPPPANSYRTPNRSTPPPRGDSTSPTLLSDTGVDDDDHHPPPPPAPNEGTSK